MMDESIRLIRDGHLPSTPPEDQRKKRMKSRMYYSRDDADISETVDAERLKCSPNKHFKQRSVSADGFLDGRKVLRDGNPIFSPGGPLSEADIAGLSSLAGSMRPDQRPTLSLIPSMPLFSPSVSRRRRTEPMSLSSPVTSSFSPAFPPKHQDHEMLLATAEQRNSSDRSDANVSNEAMSATNRSSVALGGGSGEGQPMRGGNLMFSGRLVTPQQPTIPMNDKGVSDNASMSSFLPFKPSHLHAESRNSFISLPSETLPLFPRSQSMPTGSTIRMPKSRSMEQAFIPSRPTSGLDLSSRPLSAPALETNSPSSFSTDLLDSDFTPLPIGVVAPGAGSASDAANVDDWQPGLSTEPSNGAMEASAGFPPSSVQSDDGLNVINNAVATECLSVCSNNDDENGSIQFSDEDDFDWNPDAERLAEEKPMQSKIVLKFEILPHDILLGRGGHAIHHKGNIWYRGLIRDRVRRYMASKKQEKTSMSEEMVQEVLSHGGRFLCKEQKRRQKKERKSPDGDQDDDQSAEESGEEVEDGGFDVAEWKVLDLKQARRRVSQRFREEMVKYQEDPVAWKREYSLSS